MKTHIILIAALIGCASAGAGQARTFAGPRGGSGSATVNRKGTTGTASFSGTTAAGRSASGSANATFHPSTGTVTGAGDVTGPTGTTHGGSVTEGNGSATITGDSGQSRTWTRPQ